jgi:hypothetical protein
MVSPFYVGYNPATARKYPGKGITKGDISYAYKIGNPAAMGGTDEVIREIFGDGADLSKFKFLKGPEELVRQTLREIDQEFSASVSAIPAAYENDYNMEAAPGTKAYRFKFSPVQLIKDPWKLMKENGRSAIQNIFSDEDAKQHILDGWHNALVAEDPIAAGSSLGGISGELRGSLFGRAMEYMEPSAAAKKSLRRVWSKTDWEDRFDPAHAGSYGVVGTPHKNPLALEGLGITNKQRPKRSVVRDGFGKVVLDTMGNPKTEMALGAGLGGWRGHKKNGRARVVKYDASFADYDPSKANNPDVLVEMEYDAGEELKDSWKKFQKNLRPMTRSKAKVELDSSIKNFVATSANQEYQKRRSAGIARDRTDEVFEQYCAMAHFSNLHEEAGEKFETVNNFLEKQRTRDSAVTPVKRKVTSKEGAEVKYADANDVIVEITQAGIPWDKRDRDKKVLLRYNETKKQWSGTMVDYAKAQFLAEEQRDAVLKTFDPTNRDDVAGRKAFEKELGNYDRNNETLRRTFGYYQRDAKGDLEFIPTGTGAERLYKAPNRQTVASLYKETENYMGLFNKARGGGRGQWISTTNASSVSSRINKHLAYDLIAKEGAEMADMLYLEGSDAHRAIFFSRYSTEQARIDKWNELADAIKTGKIIERYGWNDIMKPILKAYHVAFTPGYYVKKQLQKMHYLGLVVQKDKWDNFDALMEKSPLLAKTKLNTVFENSFSLQLDDGTKTWKTGKLRGGTVMKGVSAGKGTKIKDVCPFKGLDNMRTFVETTEGMATLELILLHNEKIVIKGSGGKLEMSAAFMGRYFPQGTKIDPDKLQKSLGKLQDLQYEMEAFKMWVTMNASALGINPATMTMDMYKELIIKLQTQNRLLGLTRKYAGVLEKFSAFGNKLQGKILRGKLMQKLGVTKIFERAGLQTFAWKELAKRAVKKSLVKLAEKIGLHAALQAVGSAVPVLGNLAAAAVEWVVEKVIDKTVKAVTKTAKAAWKFVVKGEMVDIEKQLDAWSKKQIKKWGKIALICMLILAIVSFFKGTFIMLGPNGVGTLLGSATIHTPTNLTSNPYIVMLSTFSDIDPTREYSLLDQSSEYDWDAWPPEDSAGTMSPGQNIPGQSYDWGEGRLWCFNRGAPTVPADLPMLPIGDTDYDGRSNGPVPAPDDRSDGYISNPLVQREYEIVEPVQQGFWCWNNFSPEYCKWENTGNMCDLANDGIFDWREFIQHPNHCYTPLGLTPCSGLTEKIKWDYSLFWCTQLATKAFNSTPGEMYVGGATRDAIRKALIANNTTNLNRFVDAAAWPVQGIAPGDVVFIGPVLGSGQKPVFENLTHVAVIYDAGLDYIKLLETNTLTKTAQYTVSAGSYPRLGGNAIWYYGLSLSGDVYTDRNLYGLR